MRSLLEIIGLVDAPKHVPVLQPLVPKEPNGKQWGTPAYKYGAVYLYCRPADREIAKRLAKEKGISVIELLHRMLAVADVNKVKIHADPNPVIPADQIWTMKAGEFMEKYFDEPIRRYREISGDKK